MCDKCNNNILELADIAHDRRKFLKMGTTLAAVSLLAGLTQVCRLPPQTKTSAKGRILPRHMAPQASPAPSSR